MKRNKETYVPCNEYDETDCINGSVSQRSDIYRKIMEELIYLHEKKSKDYGDAFAEALNDPAIDYHGGLYQLKVKFDRVRNLLYNCSDPEFESISDSLMDLANYSVMFAAWLANNRLNGKK